MVDREIMSMIVLSAISVLGVMIAVNAVGKVRMAFSWLLVTILLVGNIIVVGGYLKEKSSAYDEAAYTDRLAAEKTEVMKSLEVSQEGTDVMDEHGLKSGEVEKLKPLLGEASKIAESLVVLNLDDFAVSEKERMEQASRINAEVRSLAARYAALKGDLVYFRDKSLSRAFEKLGQSAKSYEQYYSSSDSEQEDRLERVMRSNAIDAKELFSKAERSLDSMK